MLVYDFMVRNAAGDFVSLEPYRGTVTLLVNTASQCGYVKQLPALENLYQKYKKKKFSVLAFPSNQFRSQEPGSNAEIQELYHTKYGVTFPIFGKILINGPQADPLYQFLKSEKRFDDTTVVPEKMRELYLEADPYYETSADVKWNFTKFLVSRKGEVVARYEPEVLPEEMEKDIKRMLRNEKLINWY